MTWEQFLAIVKKYDLEETDTLMMSGVVFDNGFRGLMMYDKVEFEAPDEKRVRNPLAPRQVRLTPKLWDFSVNQDFVWMGGNFIRCGGLGGHPALAKTDTIYCAGRTIESGFFFHSGHYKPKRRHGLSFFVAFVTTCVEGLSGGERDNLVHRLCSTVWLKFYRPGTNGKVEEEPFTFCQEFEQKQPVLVFSASSSSSSVSARSSPMQIGGTTGVPRSTPMPIGFGGAQTTAASSTSSTSSTSSISSSSSTYSTPPMAIKSKVDTSGESGYVKFVNDSPNVNLTITPVWIPDSEVTKCHKCQSAFGTFTRKHHCRQCGNIFCSTCCSKKKIVPNPAKNPKEAEDANKPLRVCNPCFALTKL